MDFRDSADEAAFRARLRDWLSVHAKEFPTSGDEYWAKQGEWHRALYAGGFFGVTWPKEYGGQELPPIQPTARTSRDHLVLVHSHSPEIDDCQSTRTSPK